MAFHATISLSLMPSNTRRASTSSPHFSYIPTSADPIRESTSMPADLTHFSTHLPSTKLPAFLHAVSTTATVTPLGATAPSATIHWNIASTSAAILARSYAFSIEFQETTSRRGIPSNTL